MAKSTVVPFELPSEFSPDPLTEVIQAGAKELAAHGGSSRGVRRSSPSTRICWMRTVASVLVRHGFLPEREMMTGIGTVPVQVPRVRDRGANEDGSKIKFRSALVPPYLRKRSRSKNCCPGFT